MINPRFMGDFCQETKDWEVSYIGHSSKLPIMDLDDRLRAIEKRLLIIGPSVEAFAKYPALAEAYEEYRMVEKLILGSNET